MTALPSSITDLLEVAGVAQHDSADLGSVMELLKVCEPSLLLATGRDGRVVFVDEFGAGTGEGNDAMPTRVAAQLRGSQTCRFEVSTGGGLGWASRCGYQSLPVADSWHA